MPVLWPGHRWEDYQVRIIDSGWNQIGSLGTTYKLRGVRSLYGQFKGELTLALDKRDPWAQFLLERQVHFIQVLRDGSPVFEGFQIKLDREDTIADAERWIEFAFLPLAFMLHWRIGMPEGIKLNWIGPLDDNFKEIVRLTIGPTAPVTPTSGLARIMPGFLVQANASLAPAIAIDASGAIIYEIIQMWASAHKVDWDIRFTANLQPEFRTYYPRRGTDRTESGPNVAKCIFSDDQGNFTKQSYGQDTSDLKDVFYDRLATIDVAAGPTRIANWLLREGIIDSGDAVEMQVALANADLKEWYKLEKFEESLDKQWRRHFWTGDEITWKSNRLGYGPHDDTVAMMEFEIDEAGFEHLTPTFGKPEPDIRDNLRGGGRGKNRPNYTPPTIWHIFGDFATNLDPDATNAIGVVGDGVTTTSTENAATNRTVIAAIPGGTCLWVRDDIDATGAVVSGLHTGVAAEPVMVGADSSIEVPNWQADAGYDTKFHVEGNIWVGRLVHSTTNSLALCGWHSATENIVHIFDPAGRISKLDVYNAGVRHHMLDSDIGNASYIRGFFEIRDAGGAIGHSMNAVSGAIILNEQGLNTGHVRIESVGNANMVYVDALNNRVGILDGAPGHTFDVGGDVNIVTGAGLMINDTATNRHVLIGDGTRGVFRALVAADLPAISNIWTRAGTSVYTTTGGDDVVPNAGNGTLGLVGDPWDMLYADAITVTGAGTIGILANDLLVNATVDDLYLRAADIMVFQTGGAVTRWVMSAAGNLYPNAAYSLGLAGQRCSTVYGVAGNFSGDVTIANAVGIINTGRVANRFVLISDGVRFQGRALLAADLGGHVHAVTWDNVATGAGTNHSHVLTFGGVASGGGSAHLHTIAGNTANYTPGLNAVCVDANLPVGGASPVMVWCYVPPAAPGTAAWRLIYARGGTHLHAFGTLVTNNENAHVHTYDKAATPTNTENVHTHLYNEPNTPTGGPA